MRPRRILSGRTYMVTRRTSERRFFLRPSEEVNQAITYCLARALRRAGVTLHLAVFLSNHYHLIVTDPEGNLPLLTEELNKLIGRCLNCLHKRGENLWAGATQASYVELATPQDVLAKGCYTLLNPVLGGLVKSWRDWPGVLIVKPGTYQAPRPRFFFRDEENGGALPKMEEFQVRAPPIADKPGRSMQVLHDLVKAFQKQVVRHRLASGKGFLGAKRVREQSIWDAPKTPAPAFQMSPRLACRDKWRRIEVLGQLSGFDGDYEAAREKWRDGDRGVLFPAGTYLMRVLHRVECADALDQPALALAGT